VELRLDRARRELLENVLVRRHVPVSLRDSSWHGRDGQRSVRRLFLPRGTTGSGSALVEARSSCSVSIRTSQRNLRSAFAVTHAHKKKADLKVGPLRSPNDAGYVQHL
jgi:hypothetical protein